MALQSMTALASITLQQSATSVTFSDIPNNYTDLTVVLAAIPTVGGVTGLMQINGDSASNYFMTGIRGNSSTAVSYFQNVGYGFFDYAGDTVVNTITSSIIIFIDYSQTNKHKTFLVRQSNASDTVEILAHRWASNNAINSLRFYWSTGSIAAGSTFNLYGRIA